MVAKPIDQLDGDPVLAAAQRAPVVQGSSAELAAFEEGLADTRAGRTVTAEQAQMRLRARER